MFGATGVYHLDLAVALHNAQGIEVMVVNPKAAKHFADAAMIRTKTDALDAAVLAEYAQRMRFIPWQRPNSVLLGRCQGINRMRWAYPD